MLSCKNRMTSAISSPVQVHTANHQ